MQRTITISTQRSQKKSNRPNEENTHKQVNGMWFRSNDNPDYIMSMSSASGENWRWNI